MSRHQELLDSSESQDKFVFLEDDFLWHDESLSCIQYVKERRAAMVMTTATHINDDSIWVGVITQQENESYEEFLETLHVELVIKVQGYRSNIFTETLESFKKMIHNLEDSMKVFYCAGSAVPAILQTAPYDNFGVPEDFFVGNDMVAQYLHNILGLSLSPDYPYAHSAKTCTTLVSAIVDEVIPRINSEAVAMAQNMPELLENIDGVRMTIAVAGMLRYFAAVRVLCERNTLLLTQVRLPSDEEFRDEAHKVVDGTEVKLYPMEFREGEGNTRFDIEVSERN